MMMLLGRRASAGRADGSGQLSRRRVRAIVRKELREYRRNRSVLVALAIFPLIFLIQPIVVVYIVPASKAAQLSHGHVLLYMLALLHASGTFHLWF